MPSLSRQRTETDSWIPGFDFLTIFYSRARFSGIRVIFRHFMINPSLHIHNIKTLVFLAFVSSNSHNGSIIGNKTGV